MIEGSRIERGRDRLLRVAEVSLRTGLGRPSIYRKMREGTFPRQVKISANCCAWYESDINLWVADPMGWRAPADQAA